MVRLSQQTAQWFSEVRRRLDLNTLGDYAGRLIRRALEQQFETRGLGRWQPLKPSTMAAKRLAMNPMRAARVVGRAPIVAKSLKSIRARAQGGYGARLPAGQTYPERNAPRELMAGGGLRQSYADENAPGHVHEVTGGVVTEGSEYLTRDGVPLAAIQAHGHSGGVIIKPRQRYRTAQRYTRQGRLIKTTLAPTGRQALAFIGADGEMVFRRSVRQGALPPRNPTELTEQQVDEIMDALMDYVWEGRRVTWSPAP